MWCMNLLFIPVPLMKNVGPFLKNCPDLKCGMDFKLGYSPERINPGDKEHTITTITKIVSACDEEALEEIAKVYELVVKAGVFKASSIKGC